MGDVRLLWGVKDKGGGLSFWCLTLAPCLPPCHPFQESLDTDVRSLAGQSVPSLRLGGLEMLLQVRTFGPKTLCVSVVPNSAQVCLGDGGERALVRQPAKMGISRADL